MQKATKISFRRCCLGKKEDADTQTDLPLPWVPVYDQGEQHLRAFLQEKEGWEVGESNAPDVSLRNAKL